MSNTLTCVTKDQQKVNYDMTLLNLTDTQEKTIKKHVSQYSFNELGRFPLKLKLSKGQRKQLLECHKQFINFLRDKYDNKSDEEIGLDLIENKDISFSEHSLERISERFYDEVSPNFVSLINNWGRDKLIEASKKNVINLLFNATDVEEKIEFNMSKFCRINYRLYMDNSVVVVEENILDPDHEIFNIITVIKKAA